MTAPRSTAALLEEQLSGVWLRVHWAESEAPPLDQGEGQELSLPTDPTTGLIVVDSALFTAANTATSNDGPSLSSATSSSLRGIALWAQSPAPQDSSKIDGSSSKSHFYYDWRRIPHVAAPFGGPRCFAGAITVTMTGAESDETHGTETEALSAADSAAFVSAWNTRLGKLAEEEEEREGEGTAESTLRGGRNSLLLFEILRAIGPLAAHTGSTNNDDSVTPQTMTTAISSSSVVKCVSGPFRTTWRRDVDSLPASCPSGVDSALCLLVSLQLPHHERDTQKDGDGCVDGGDMRLLFEIGDGYEEVWLQTVAINNKNNTVDCTVPTNAVARLGLQASCGRHACVLSSVEGAVVQWDLTPVMGMGSLSTITTAAAATTNPNDCTENTDAALLVSGAGPCLPAAIVRALPPFLRGPLSFFTTITSTPAGSPLAGSDGQAGSSQSTLAMTVRGVAEEAVSGKAPIPSSAAAAAKVLSTVFSWEVSF